MTRALRNSLRAGIAALAIGLTAPSATAYVSPGDYLAARAAWLAYDFDQAAGYFGRALLADADNPVLMEQSLRANVGLGRFDLAMPTAERLVDLGIPSPIGALVLLTDRAQKQDWEAILEGQANGTLTVTPLISSLVGFWALTALDRPDEAATTLREALGPRRTRALGLYHQALSLILKGDYAGAEAIFSGERGPGLTLGRRGLMARIEALSQLGRNDEALEIIAATFGTRLDPPVARLKERLEAGEALPVTIVTSPAEGVAEVLHTIAETAVGDRLDILPLALARASAEVSPGNIDALLLAASQLERMQQYALAVQIYDRIPGDSDFVYAAELSRAEALRRIGPQEEGLKALEDLARRYDTLPAAQIALGDAMRDNERWAEASDAYTRALELMAPAQPEHWMLYFLRAITQERLKDWGRAEADLRKSLELYPNQPMVMNFLGYSMLEQQGDLGEALALIEGALKERPNDGAITDSLGWAYYRLGRYAEAVPVMERAASLMPVDAEVNDHLGDVFWAVGRKREAEFQWRRALSLKDDRDVVDFERIRRKLEVGLDAVLAEEGAPPLGSARGN